MAQAQTRVVTITCDVCGKDIPAGTGFSPEIWDPYLGTVSEADLCQADADKLDRLVVPIQQFVGQYGRPARMHATAQRPSGRPRSRGRRGAREGAREARAWLQANGYEIGNRGRIPADMMAAYEAAAR
jgi:hypothetical protein